MCDASVYCWLKNLRYDCEQYGPYDEKFFEIDYNLDMEESIYEQIWSCTTDFELKYASVCQESVEFDDQLSVIPSVNCAHIEIPEPQDVMLWKNQIRDSYYEEEQTILESQEVPKSANNTDTTFFPPNFQVDSQGDGDVQFRRNHNIQEYRVSKTTDFRYGVSKDLKFRDKDFKVKSCLKIQLPGDGATVKLKKSEFIKYQNGSFYKCDPENYPAMTLLRPNVILKTAKLNKKEVELRDANNLTYVFTFDSVKDARHFIESDKIINYVESDYKSTITKTLMRLLGKRSSRDILEKKGIYQNEPIFGNTLKNIFAIEKSVPRFILKTIELIEGPENITSLGLYRTSGNLATIQKIRFEVDKGRLDILNDFAKDADVLTGSLKLFFRELKEPLIPCEICDKLLNLTRQNNTFPRKDRDKIEHILSKLPEANLETLKVLIRHLMEVVKFKDGNKMDTYNLAVCWAPTVIFATESFVSKSSKDLVTQSTEATKLFDNLLTFYVNNPDELDMLQKRQDLLDPRKYPILPQEFRERLGSSGQKKESSLVPNVDEVVQKITDWIEANPNKAEGIYKNTGSMEKVAKLYKKMSKRKLYDIEKYKEDTVELAEAFRRYLQEHEPVVTKEVIDLVNQISENAPYIDLNVRQKILSAIRDLPLKETLIFLLKHILTMFENEPVHKVLKSELIAIWTDILNHHKITTNQDFSKFLKTLLDVVSEKYSDPGIYPKGMTESLLKDLINQQKDRSTRKQEHVPEENSVTISEEQFKVTELTRL